MDQRECRLAAVLVAFFAFGFFAAGLLSVFWLIIVSGLASLAALVIAICQGSSILHALGLSVGALSLSQVGYGLGLLRVAAMRNRCIPD